jgi:hypothetical protein
LPRCGRGYEANEQNASYKKHCHPSRELFRAGDLLFFHFIVRQNKQQIPRSAVGLSYGSGIAAERGMTVIWLLILSR